MSSPATVQQPHPSEVIVQSAIGYMPSACLRVATRMQVADRLAGGPRSVKDLAAAAHANEDALYRVLRALASIGVFQETAPRTFANTPPSDYLRADHPESVRDLVLWMSDKFHFDVYGHFDHSVETGETCVEQAVHAPVFEYFAKPENQAESEVFNNAMTTFSARVIPAVLETYDFSGIGTLCDVAGGHGYVLTAILEKYPPVCGILFDLEHVVAGARPRIEALGLGGRCQTLSGDFFKEVPAADAYVMKHIIHDWDDARALTILRNCQKHLAARGRGKVILLEAVLAPGNEPHLGKWIDIEMLAMPGGRERTEEDFRQLFARAGLRLTRVVPNPSPLAVIEAEYAQ